MSKSLGKKIVVKFTQEIVGDVSSNIPAFKVEGKQYKYVNGPLINGDYQIESIVHHPTVANALLLTMNHLKRFSTVEGSLTVSYDASKGNLTGTAGAVESFIETFIPLDLVPEPNPNAEENISVAPFEIVAELKDIVYPKGYGEQGNISVAPFEVTATLINVEDINP